MPTGIYKRNPMSEETKDKIRQKKLGTTQPEWVKQKIRETLSGTTLTPEHKQKISNALKGNTFRKGKVPWNKGMPRSLETKQKISMTKQGQEEFNCFSKPEQRRLRQTAEYFEWRKNVFIRDNYTCQNCGKTNCFLEAHHIKSFKEYEELRTDIDNGITYCIDCHKEIDELRR